MKSIGLALGGGGVRGLAHIPILETLDAMGLRPSVLAGTSMGAIVGALYASGCSGRALRRLVRAQTLSKSDKTLRRLVDKRGALFRWLRAMAPDFRGGGLMHTDRFIRFLADELRCTTFSGLTIPLTIVAADFWKAEPVVLEEGDLLSAIQASMAVPGVFPPVEREGRVLVDGGLVNLVPYDLLRSRCEVAVAVDVAGAIGAPPPRRIPRLHDAILGAFDITQATALEHKLRLDPPDILIRVGLRDIPAFDFSQVDEVLRRGRLAANALRRQLEERAPRRRRAAPPAEAKAKPGGRTSRRA